MNKLQKPGTGCSACNKVRISLLVLRPGLVAKDPKLGPIGASKLTVDAALLKDVTPSRTPTESTYVLRFLRTGYVHVFLPSPPEGVAPWQVYRVMANGDLTPHTDKANFFGNPPKPACVQEGHNSAGMKLLTLPQGVQSLWMAYSANLWSDKLRNANKANPQEMQFINLSDGAKGNANCFKPTAEALNAQVFECGVRVPVRQGLAALDALTGSVASKVGATPPAPKFADALPYLVSNDWPSAEALADNLSRAAACSPKTAGLELAVVLRDPVGIAVELNAIRLKRADLREQYNLQPQVRHALEVNKFIQLMRGQCLTDADEQAMRNVAPLMNKGQFEYNKASFPAGTTWAPLEPEERKARDKGAMWASLAGAPLAGAKMSAADLGRVHYPDEDDRMDRWIQEASQAEWRKMLPYYDDTRRAQWETSYLKAIDQLVAQPLRREEADWAAALDDAALKRYFARHFDEGEANDPQSAARKGCCAGTVYQQETEAAFCPEPLSDAADPVFNAQLDLDITDQAAVMKRAVLANQASLFTILESSVFESDDSKRDKLYDAFKGLLGEINAANIPQTGKALAWLTNANLGLSLGLVGTLSAVATHGAAKAWEGVATRKAAQALTAGTKVAQRLATATNVAQMHRICEEALQAALNQRLPKQPVLVSMSLDADALAQVMQIRGRPMNKRLRKALAKKGHIKLLVWTDSDKLRELSQLVLNDQQQKIELARGAGAVTLEQEAVAVKKAAPGTAAAALAGAGAGTAKAMLVLPLRRVLPLIEAHQAQAARAPALVTRWLIDMGKTGGQALSSFSSGVTNLRAGALSLEGRLAVGSMLVQGMGVLKAMQSWGAAGDDADKLLDARLSFADGMAGFLGGSAELAGAVWEARLAAAGGKLATDASVVLPVLKGWAFGMGAAGNFLNAWMNFRAAEKLEKGGNWALSANMRRAGYLFVGGGIPLTLMAVHSFAEAAAKRGLLSVGAKTVVEVVGKQLASRALFLTVPGWGWAITVVSVGVTVGVIWFTPTPMQNWLKLSYFGKPDKESDRRKSWADEEMAMKALFAGYADEKKEEQPAEPAPPGYDYTGVYGA